MAYDRCENMLYELVGARGRGIDWEGHYRGAVAAGSGVAVSPDEERVAAVDELLAASLEQLVVVGELAAFASFTALVEDCRVPLARSSARLVRLLDGALTAHGRDCGYEVRLWREGTVTMADAAAAGLRDAAPEEHPLPDALRRAARLIAEALIALARDRLGVPEAIAQAASELLVVYVAAVRLSGAQGR